MIAIVSERAISLILFKRFGVSDNRLSSARLKHSLYGWKVLSCFCSTVCILRQIHVARKLGLWVAGCLRSSWALARVQFQSCRSQHE
jgi:hypothetical protein